MAQKKTAALEARLDGDYVHFRVSVDGDSLVLGSFVGIIMREHPDIERGIYSLMTEAAKVALAAKGIKVTEVLEITEDPSSAASREAVEH